MRRRPCAAAPDEPAGSRSLTRTCTTPPLHTDFIANGTVPVLAEQVSTAPREKVIRVALAALHNLCYGRLDTLNAEMISCGLPKTLENLLDRKW